MADKQVHLEYSPQVVRRQKTRTYLVEKIAMNQRRGI